MPDWNDERFWNQVGGQFGTGGPYPTQSVKPTNMAPTQPQGQPATKTQVVDPMPPPSQPPPAAPAPTPGQNMLGNQLFGLANMIPGFQFGNMAPGAGGDVGPGAPGADGGVGTTNFGDYQFVGNPLIYQNGIQQGPGPFFGPAGGGPFATNASPQAQTVTPTSGPLAPVNLPEAPQGGMGQGPFGNRGPTYGDIINMFNGYNWSNNGPLRPGDGAPGTSQLFGSGTEGQPGANGGNFYGSNGGMQGNVGGYQFGSSGTQGGSGGGGDMPWQRSAAEREAR